MMSLGSLFSGVGGLDGIERTLWEVREPRSHQIIRAGEHPELSWLYTTEGAARAAAEAVAERLADTMTARAERWNEREQPDAAKRAWADDSKTACFTEMRVTGWAVEWGADRDRHRPRWWPEDGVMTLTVDTEVRHRWREVQHRREVAEDGTITVVDALGEPSEWTEWHAPLPLESGGLHFSPVSLEVRPTKLRFAPGQDLAGWATTTPDWLDAEWAVGPRGITSMWWMGRDESPEMTTRLDRALDSWVLHGTPVGPGPRTWREVCGTACTERDLTMDAITRTPRFGRELVRELLALLRSAELDPVWARDAERYYRLGEALL